MRAWKPSTSAIHMRSSAGPPTRSADLTVVGPELPLDHGVVDRFREHGIRIFGPSHAAAQLECSKAFAKDFMSRHGIPTARYRVCESAAAAHEVVDGGELGFPS